MVKSHSLKQDTDYKLAWLKHIETCENPKKALQTFCYNYYYFSIFQILAFSKLIAKVSPYDRETLAILAQTVYDELGCGVTDQVHSLLFERFMMAVGVSIVDKPGYDTVLPHVRSYLRELDLAFSGDSLPKALATYVYLEKSATESYRPMFDTLQKALPTLTQEELIFFSHHAILEPEHEKAARLLVTKQNFSEKQMDEFDRQFNHLAKCWNLFWRDIYQETLLQETVLQELCVS